MRATLQHTETTLKCYSIDVLKSMQVLASMKLLFLKFIFCLLLDVSLPPRPPPPSNTIFVHICFKLRLILYEFRSLQLRFYNIQSLPFPLKQTMVSYHDTTEDVTSAWFSLNTSARPSVDDNEDSVVGPILTGVVLAIIVTCTVVGNVMVLLAVFVNSHLRSTTNYFIVNLAIADLLLGTTVLPFSASLEVFKVSEYICTFK